MNRNITNFKDLVKRKIDDVDIIDPKGVLSIILDNGEVLHVVTREYIDRYREADIQTTISQTKAQYAYELERPEIAAQNKYEWMKWTKEIPFLNFDRDIVFKPIPPFNGAITRFLVAHKNNTEESLSVYFDAYTMLGYHEGPYWEVYPIEEDTCRFKLSETDEMVKLINDKLRYGRKSRKTTP